MATTITAGLSASVEYNNFKDTIAKTLTVTLNNLGGVFGVQNIGTTAEDIAMGDLSTANQGYCFLQNQDATNFVSFGWDDGGTIKEIGKLKPGEWCWFRLMTSKQLMAKADTAAINLEYRIYRD